MRILMSGSSGLLGSALRYHLTGQGHEILRLIRDESTNDESCVFWNPSADMVRDRDRLTNIDAVINLAGSNVAAGRWNAKRKQSIRSSRIRSTRLLASICAGLPAKPRVFLSASATGFYGNRGDELLAENSSPGDGFLSSVTQDWEASTSPASLAGIRVAHMRIGVVLAADGGALKKMLPAFRLGLGGSLGSGTQVWSWIHLHDLCRAIDFLLSADTIDGPVNLVAPNPATNVEFTRALAAALRRPAFMNVPATAARLLMGEMADELLLASAKVIPGKLQVAGFGFEFPELRTAFENLLHGQPACCTSECPATLHTSQKH